MKPIIVLVAVLAVLLALPSTSFAQYRRYGRSGVVMSPYGPLYDTRSPEWRMSGGNIFVYEQLMEAKMMARQQQMMMMKQQMIMMKQQRKSQQARRSGAGLNAANADQFGGQGAAVGATRQRKKPRVVPGAQNPLVKRKEIDATPAPAANAKTNAQSSPSSKPAASTPSQAPPNAPSR
jgi:hypothetical protein